LKAKLIGGYELAPGVGHFDFEAAGVEELAFKPGQFISIKEQVDGKEIIRAYSIASPRDGNRFSLCLNCVEEGLISPRLFSLKPGDVIEIGEPLGYFTLRHPGRRALSIATGTGIAPFRSMLRDQLPTLDVPVTLLFGVRHEGGLLYRAEFEELAAKHPNFRFLPTVTRPTPAWTGRSGRVQTHLDEALAIESDADRVNTDVYICGLKEMVDDVRAELKRRGLDRKQIIYEKYD
jgi:ferredoxin-NADP reductase